MSGMLQQPRKNPLLDKWENKKNVWSSELEKLEKILRKSDFFKCSSWK